MESFDQVFRVVKEHCEKKLSATAYNLWIRPIQPIDFKDSTAFLYVKSDFQKNIVDSKYVPLMKEYLKELLGFDVSIKVLVEEENHEDFEKEIESKEKENQKKKIFSIDESYTFENFIVGPSNTFAFAACRAVVKDQNESYNPLFIYGPSGLGKTHLLMAICHSLKNKYPEYKILYINGETFTNELISSIENRKTPEFREKYRKIDVLLMDDVQFLAGKTQTQEEFFHTFNELHRAGRQIVLTSDRPPKDIKTLEERLRTRFEWGLLADVSPPDIETRIAVIKRKAELMEFSIPDNIAEYLAKNLKNNIRQLEGAVKKFKAYDLLADSVPSTTMAQSIIREILNDDQPTPVTIEKIISETGNTFGVSIEDIRSSKRSSQVSTARQISMYIVREITQLPYTEIGKEFNNRDHATVVYALQKVESIMKKDARQKEIIEDIIKNIRNE